MGSGCFLPYAHDVSSQVDAASLRRHQGEHMFTRQMFGYSLPDGTRHFVMWCGLKSKRIRDCDPGFNHGPARRYVIHSESKLLPSENQISEDISQVRTEGGMRRACADGVGGEKKTVCARAGAAAKASTQSLPICLVRKLIFQRGVYDSIQ